MEQTEKRREPRFPFQLPLEMTRITEPEERISGTTRNISLNGFMVLSASELPRGEHVVCSFNLAGTDEKSWSEGVVKWSSSNGKSSSGIEMLEENTLLPPLLQSVEACLQEKSSYQAPEKSPYDYVARLQEKLYSETYWGLLFRLFHRPLLTELIGLCGEFELRNFYLKKEQARIRKLKPNKETDDFLNDTEKTLDKSRQALDNVIVLLQQFAAEKGPEKEEQFPEGLRLNELCRERINWFNQKVGPILSDDAAGIGFAESEESPLVLGRRREIERALDLLLLYSYQFIIFFRAGEVRVSMERTENQVRLSLFNNGTKIFEKDRLELECRDPDFLEDFKLREQKQLAILCCALELLTSVKASMSLVNQSGNNRLIVKIPRTTP